MTRDVAWFDRLYSADPDPWKFQTSDYEREKYAATLDALTQARFASGLEIGCAIGVLTQHLAGRCDRLLAVDFSETALALARPRLAGLPHVAVERRAIPADWPAGRYDLIVLSEILYFLAVADVDHTAALARRDLVPGGTVLLVNWLGETETPLSGEAAADRFLAAFGPVAPVTTERRPGYRLDRVPG